MNRPIALDICCRKGGATVGLQRATTPKFPKGFYVIGVDIEPQPEYPGDEFWQVDGLKLLGLLSHSGGAISHFDLGSFRPALIWQSWPCQDGNTATASNRARGLVDTH